MPVSAGTKTYFSFVKGIITEASPLIYPEDSAISVDNFLLIRDGSIARRLGIDYEASHTLIDSGSTANALATSAIYFNTWNNVANNPTLKFGVVQVGTKLWFFDMFKTNMSSNIKNSGNYLDMGGLGQERINVSSINGYLIITSKEFSPVYLEYNSSTDTVSKSPIVFYIRDLFGIDDQLPVNNRPTSLSDSHKYNLLNQGWDITSINAFFASKSVYPSNADIQALGKDADENFDPDLVVKQYFGNTPAPKGRNIINAFNRGVSRQEQSNVYIASSFYDVNTQLNFNNLYIEREPLTGEWTVSNYTNFTSLPVDQENSRVSVSAPYSGRVFYSGVESLITTPDERSPDYTGFIFFTKLISSVKDLGECYQEADPTSEHISDIIATDGGYIQIPDAANIFKLVPTDRSLLVLAENGVWEIVGDTDSGFSATGYQVNKIGSIGAMSPSSIVEVEGVVAYWAEGGIYTLGYDQQSGYLRPQNISATTIQSLYSSIPSTARKLAKGSFDPETRRISWIYNDQITYDGISNKFNYNRELIFDTLLQAFYTNTIESIDADSNSPQVAGLVVMPNFVTVDYANPIVVNGEQVQVNTVDVAVTAGKFARGESYTKYLTILPNNTGNLKFTFSSYRNGSFTDWYTYDDVGENYISELTTGFEIVGDSSKWKQSPYVSFHFTRTETGFTTINGGLEAISPSGCLVSARWDFANHSNSGKIGPQFQAYRLLRNYIPTDANDEFNYGQSVIVTKNKIRGKGKALSMNIQSQAGKDMKLLGWSMPFIVGDAT